MPKIFLKSNTCSTTYLEKETLFLSNQVDIYYMKRKSVKQTENLRISKEEREKTTACFPFLQLLLSNIQQRDGSTVKQHSLKCKVLIIAKNETLKLFHFWMTCRR